MGHKQIIFAGEDINRKICACMELAPFVHVGLISRTHFRSATRRAWASLRADLTLGLFLIPRKPYKLRGSLQLHPFIIRFLKRT